MRLGTAEIIVILLIVILLFGAGKISRLGAELGEAIKNFKKGLSETKPDDESDKKS